MHTYFYNRHKNTTGFLDSLQIEEIERRYKQANHEYHFPRKKQSHMCSDDGESIINEQIYDLHSQNKNVSPMRGTAESDQTFRHKILSIKQIKQYKVKKSLVSTNKLKLSIKNSPYKSRSTSRGINLSLSKTKKQMRSACVENKKKKLCRERTGSQNEKKKKITLYSNRKIGEVSQFQASSPVKKLTQIPVNKSLAQVRTINIYH